MDLKVVDAMIPSESILTKFLNDSDIIICLKDQDRKVLHQNENCLRLCGNHKDQECNIGCMELYTSDSTQQWPNWGSRTYKNQLLHDDYFDVTIISSSSYILTILQAMRHKYNQALEYYSKFNLGKRELEVIRLAITGMSNLEIAKQLAISVGTLRTHLKNIYNKVKDAGESVEFLPFERK
ncbi:MAG TPA: LuxR C-terminal-related transcriptional regulator [Pseudomonadales bacterium]|jgi:DNA-binding CsgD family transcriptional regulator|nr:hypothetical protein [Gammaproteobacteria bacterium]MDP6026817.1 LuxR C-terminal-related transcriptional regulator [Pseudomonadales bacterium]MDP6316320.1 LuxR C-terminal-related transcriptional regulator [Pseudomonadales bacterium]MDP7314910.1 LuxR C-terminal-related transcriptional regulator [Pseudomonadales bacterium]HJL62276.1 LuxR C-terminal-related transcriptional regulator [Pseudomonadales bacterium]|tara:strand:+ start:280 stop:822 length:543 start_codon:yes stop_codon:yes gene_type:complete